MMILPTTHPSLLYCVRVNDLTFKFSPAQTFFDTTSTSPPHQPYNNNHERQRLF